MGDDETPASVGDDVAAGARVLEEQQARITALRAAVLAGAVDEATFDYVRFFATVEEPKAAEG